MVAELCMLVAGTSALSLFSTMVQKKMIDLDLVRTLKADMKKLQKEAKECKNDVDKLSKLTSKQLELSKELMSQQMKPTLVSSLPILLAFFIFGKYFSEVAIALPVTLPFIGAQIGWIGTYILVMLVTSLLFRKAMGMDLT